MTQTLSREHRRILENTAAQARREAEAGAEKALQALAVSARDAPTHASDAERWLRVRLRAHGRALGDLLRTDDMQAIDHLVSEIAYEHWHRMLFARFLAESDPLIHPDGYPVSLNDCKEDAENPQACFDPPARSECEVAGHYAARMLPNVFRPDSPALALQLPLETEQALEALLAKLPATVFQADDSLGWSYQFWQAPKKEEVQRQMKQAGTKVGADELPAVTQLFTEQYMVAFFLENALGGWWQSRHPRMKLPVEMPYLRFTPSPLAGEGRVEGAAAPPAPTIAGQPAAGTFPDWHDTLAQFKLLDPCAGSGHFLVSAFHYLVPMRRATEKLSVRDAIDRVLADNLHGLELDARCVEIAAFALALAAWRYPDEKGDAIGYLPGWDVPKLKPAIFTDHFGLVSDFLSECFTQLRDQSRLACLQNRVFFGGALSGRDLNGVNKTISGLLKLLYPAQDEAVSDEDLKWAVRLALEVRRRVKEQQKRIGAAEFRNTHFSYTLGAEGVEKFVSTPELQSQGGIGDEPLEAGQIWTLSPGGHDEHPGLFRLEVNEGPGNGVRVLNKPVPAAFQESIRCAEQNLYARAMQLVGDRDPRSHEFSVQLRGFDAAKSGAKTGVASLVALCSALLRKSVRGALVVVGELTLGGSIEPIHNAVTLAEIAVEKGARVLLLPVA